MPIRFRLIVFPEDDSPRMVYRDLDLAAIPEMMSFGSDHCCERSTDPRHVIYYVEADMWVLTLRADDLDHWRDDHGFKEWPSNAAYGTGVAFHD